MKLASIRGSQLTASGLSKSTHALDAPIWKDGSNVVFRNNGVEKVDGWAAQATITTPSSAPRGAHALENSAGNQLLFTGTTDKLYSWNGSTINDESNGTYTGVEDESGTTPATAWSFAPFDDWMLATNGVDAPQVYKATTAGSAFAALAGTPPSTAEIVVRRGPHVVFLNTDLGPNVYEWSDVGDAEDYVPTSTNGAGFQNIRELEGPIKAAINFGPRIAVLGRERMFMIDYTGAPFYFPYRPAVEGVGAVSKHACIEAGRFIYGLSEDGFWVSDGNTFNFIDQPDIERYVKDNWDSTQLSKVCCSYDSHYKMIVWSIPGTGNVEGDITVGYQPDHRSWTEFSYGRTAMVPKMGTYTKPYSVSSAGAIEKHNTGTDDDGSGMTAYIQTKPMDFGDPDKWKFVDRIKAQIRDLSGTVQIRIGWQEDVDDAIAWESYSTLDDGFEAIDVRPPNGVYFSLEIRSTEASADWSMTGFDIHGGTAGAVG